jgi:hypothetical protein
MAALFRAAGMCNMHDAVMLMSVRVAQRCRSSTGRNEARCRRESHGQHETSKGHHAESPSIEERLRLPWLRRYAST